MNKETLATQTTASLKGIFRELAVNWELELEEDQIITVEKAESWTTGGDYQADNGSDLVYFFECTNECPVHEVDYSNSEETEAICATEYEAENEVLVAAGTQFRVTYVSSEDDYNEMGYYTVEVEYIESEEN